MLFKPTQNYANRLRGQGMTEWMIFIAEICDSVALLALWIVIAVQYAVKGDVSRNAWALLAILKLSQVGRDIVNAVKESK